MVVEVPKFHTYILDDFFMPVVEWDTFQDDPELYLQWEGGRDNWFSALEEDHPTAKLAGLLP